ncbi:MAG: Hpt domain-containing protein [Bacteroidota bacterium]|nr:Hpt domain-containing protein [Bacteroidota bacterium]MDP4204613.1 Hpt domain-containing protein [Bacteroidota bacterium]
MTENYDMTYLREVSDNDNDYMLTLIRYFVDNVPLVSENLREYYENRNFKELSFSAHKFSSQLAMFGLKKASSKVSRIEQKADSCEDDQELYELISEIEQVCSQIVSRLKKDFRID